MVPYDCDRGAGHSPTSPKGGSKTKKRWIKKVDQKSPPKKRYKQNNRIVTEAWLYIYTYGKWCACLCVYAMECVFPRSDLLTPAPTWPPRSKSFLSKLSWYSVRVQSTVAKPAFVGQKVFSTLRSHISKFRNSEFRLQNYTSLKNAGMDSYNPNQNHNTQT